MVSPKSSNAENGENENDGVRVKMKRGKHKNRTGLQCRNCEMNGMIFIGRDNV